MTAKIPLRVAVIAVVAILAAAGGLSPRATAGEADVPRFVSLGSDKVNVRTGPGVRYPVAWQFVRRGLPVEVVAEFELWRKIRDLDGAEGWVHKSLLSGRRTVMVRDETRTLYRRPDVAKVPVFQAEAGVLGRLRACQAAWCELEVAGLKGWIPRDQLWGVYPNEEIE